MNGKPKVSLDKTYVFGDDELDQLDDLTFTTVIGEATESLKRPNDDDDPDPTVRNEALLESIERDSLIEMLLEDSGTNAEPAPEVETQTFFGDSAELEYEIPEEDLLDPGLMLSDDDEQT